MSRPPVSEIALSRAWAEGAIPARLLTTTGDQIEIVYRGTWTHGLGPDFCDAMVAFPNGRLQTGSIEMHISTGGWREHGHHRDPAYNAVILHVAGIDDGPETRRADGKLVPVVVVGLEQARATQAALDWSRVGGEVCAADLAVTHPALIVQALHQLGDQRLGAKAALFEAELARQTPSQVLWSGLLDALGYTENREPMRRVAERAPIIDLERLLTTATDRFQTAAALLLGTGGFLPLAPRDAETGHLTPALVHQIETIWDGMARPPGERLQPAAWRLTRVRPANHPVTRLLIAAAMLVSAPYGLLDSIIEPIRTQAFGVETLTALAGCGPVALGQDRATVITSSVIIPFTLALAEQTGDADLLEGSMSVWDRLPGSAHNRLTRAGLLQITGGTPIKHLGERGMQGILHLNRSLCTPRRCYECPIAGLVVADQT